MSTPALLTVYCVAIVAASILGGLVPLLVRLTHTRLQVAISLTAGFMFGIALLHMIPHALAEVAPAAAMTWVMGGFLTMFFLERFFSFHSHEVAELDDDGKVLTSAEDLPEHDHAAHACHHDHAHAHGMAGHTPGNKLSWTGAAIGLTLHSVIAGIALASAVASETGVADDGHAHAASVVAGLAVFLVIVLHKPLDALTVITLTASSGFTKPTRHLINGLFALAVPAGVGLFWFGMSQAAAESSAFVGYALAFSAGTFLCVALSDLLPELHFHSHDRGKLSAALVIGVVLALVMARAEHALHDHDHAPAPGSGHDHDDHTGHGHADEHLHHDGDAEPESATHDDHDHGSERDHDDHTGHDHAEPEPVTPPTKPVDPHGHDDHAGHDH